MKPRHFISTGFAGAAALYLTSCLWWGVWINWEPKYDLRNLVGLTPAQVVQRLGPPSFDPRVTDGWKSEQEDGPLSLGYTSGVYSITIRFNNDRVFRVDHYTK
jgi:hypothetical protein